MDYGKIFARAWEIIWEHKFLILLGVLVALSAGGNGNGNQAQYLMSGDEIQWGDMPAFEYQDPFRDLDMSMFAVGGIIALVGFLFLVGLVFWVAGVISRGGLIRAVDDIESEKPTGFSEAFKAGWEKGWKLLGIGLVPAVPMFILMIISLSLFVGYGGLEAITQGSFPSLGFGAFLPLIIMACLLVPAGLILGLLRNFANRACMLEDLGVLSSYKRGFEVLGDNLGPALLLFLIQVALSVGIWVMMIVPGILIALCCLLWPLLILIEGAFTSYYSTLWTLAWREWTLSELPSSSL
jgi:hypothetical protein